MCHQLSDGPHSRRLGPVTDIVLVARRHAPPVHLVGCLDERGGDLACLRDGQVVVVYRDEPLDPAVGPLRAVDQDQGVVVPVVTRDDPAGAGEVARRVRV